MRILGIDPGIASVGWGIIEAEGNRFRSVDYGYIKTTPAVSKGKRLMIIYRKIGEIIDLYNPELAGVEDIFFARNKLSAIPVAEAKGVILLAIESKDIDTRVYTPLQIKQAITGNGRAEKHQVQDMVKLILGLNEKIKPDHAADALAAAVCCYNNRALGE